LLLVLDIFVNFLILMASLSSRVVVLLLICRREEETFSFSFNLAALILATLGLGGSEGGVRANDGGGLGVPVFG